MVFPNSGAMVSDGFFDPAEWIRYIAIYYNLPSNCDIWPADKPPIYLQKSFISSGNVLLMEALKSWLLIGRANLIWPYLYVLEPTLEKKISRAEVMDAIKD